MQIFNEDLLLNEAYRKKVIDEMIYGSENVSRKDSELRKHEIYRDLNKKWVMEALVHEEFKASTLKQMENRASNVSICRKIIDKLAQSYIGGVQRTAENQSDQESIDVLSDELDVDTVFKKADRYRQLFRSTMVQVVPIPCYEEVDEQGQYKWELLVRVLAPWEFDVIEDGYDRTKPRAVILTAFPERQRFLGDQLRGSQGFRNNLGVNLVSGDQKEQTIADSPADAGTEHREFIWWSSKYHFTTNEKGQVTKAANTELLNPIGKLPFVHISQDQDGHFWPLGGSDVPDGSVLINKQLTDLNFITFNQGWGQMVVSGKNVPKKLVGGPDNAFIFDVAEGDPQPQVFFASSNPPLNEWMENIKAYLALLLSTNGLAPRNVAANLDASNTASGIAMLIEQSDIVQSLQDVQKIFQDKEPEFWDILSKWHRLYYDMNALIESLQLIKPIEDPNVVLRFHSFKPMISESEKLDNLKKRQDLGISTQLDLIMSDNPDLTKEEAEKKALEIEEEKMANQERMMSSMIKNSEVSSEEDEALENNSESLQPPKEEEVDAEDSKV